MLTWTAAKLLLGGLWQKFVTLLAFMLKPRQVFLPLLIPVAICLGVYVLWGRYDDLHTEYYAHLASDHAAKVERDAENRAKDASMKYIIEQTSKLHAVQLDILKGQYYALDKQKRGADRTVADLRRQLQWDLAEAANARLPSIPGGYLRPPESWPDGNSADLGQTFTDADYIDKLELGCAITTSDYNTLYERVEAANNIYGNKQ